MAAGPLGPNTVWSSSHPAPLAGRTVISPVMCSWWTRNLTPHGRNPAHHHVMSTHTIRLSYEMWPQYNRRLRAVISAMTPDQLAIRPSPDGWPIWATGGHDAGTRVYWLCDVIGEPGAETTPFGPNAEVGWEDDLDHPRSAEELVEGLDSTF